MMIKFNNTDKKAKEALHYVINDIGSSYNALLQKKEISTIK